MATPPPRPRLRGRDAELRALGATLDRAASGRVAVAVVEGEAGIGKTRLLAEVADEARRRGFQVASGRADELERTRPFGLLTDAFACTPGSPDPRRAGIAALLTTRVGDRGLLTVTSDPGLQFQAVDAFVDLVEALALEDPLLAGLDDLQWADPSSLLAVGAIGRRLTDVPVALVACLRPAPRPAELERLLAGLDAAPAELRTLGQLPDQAVAELVAETVGAEPGGRLMGEVAAAGGNPLFVTELVGALVQEGAVRTLDGRAEVTRVAMPPTLRLTILRRLGWASWVRALLLEAGGATEEAFATLAACWDRCARSGFAIDYPVLGPDLVRLALAAGEAGRAEGVAAAVGEVVAANDVASLTGAALRCRGLLERDPDVLRAAVEAYAGSPRVLEPALAAEDAGAAAAAQGDLAAAVPLLERALAGYERLDAARDAARAEARLRDLGVRRGRRGARRRPATGWDSLTPTERRVVDLVAEGLSNPQIGERLFVSRRTVQTHLAHVFAKLQISSRAQLAAAAAGRRAAGPGGR